MVAIREASFPDDLTSVQRLFRAYGETPGVTECVVGFEREIAGLPGNYSSPEGVILIASVGGADIGCVALRPLTDGACEMKRLYVDSNTRGSGAGRQLVRAVIDHAISRSYRALRLDTLRSMEAAHSLYRAFGFREIARYNPSAPADALFFEITLQESVL